MGKVEDLQKLEAPICGIYGQNDVQFPMLKLKSFFITPAHKSFMYWLKLEILFISNDVM